LEYSEVRNIVHIYEKINHSQERLHMKKFAKVPLSEIQVQDDYSETLIKALKKNRKFTSKTKVYPQGNNPTSS